MQIPPGMGGRSVVENGFQMSSSPVSKAFHRSQLHEDPDHLSQSLMLIEH